MYIFVEAWVTTFNTIFKFISSFHLYLFTDLPISKKMLHILYKGNKALSTHYVLIAIQAIKIFT